MLNYIVTLLLQIWLFLKLLCGLNCTTLYRVPLFDPTSYFWRIYTPIIPLLTISQLAQHYTSRLRRTNKKVTLHSTAAIDVNVRSSGPEEYLLPAYRRSAVFTFTWITAVLLASNAVAAELQNIHLSSHLHNLHGRVTWLYAACLTAVHSQFQLYITPG